METFAAGEHAEFLASGGRPLRPRLARSLALADLRPGLDLVDIGCGRGEAAARAALRGARVTAIDYSSGSLSLASRTMEVLLDPHGLGDRVDLIAADATRLPLPDRSADRVLLLDLVEHLWPWQLESLLAEIQRILRPSGYVVIHTLPNRWALALTYPLLRLVLPGMPSSARSDYEAQVHVAEQSPRSLARALDRAGFAARVWVEEWTSLQARRGAGRDYPDAQRAAAYPFLGRKGVRRMASRLMRSPARPFIGNDIFALARPRGYASDPGLPDSGRFRALA
jgi:ubiquinone/menaquinone biosynthesis C-methylase UbiE